MKNQRIIEKKVTNSICEKEPKYLGLNILFILIPFSVLIVATALIVPQELISLFVGFVIGSFLGVNLVGFVLAMENKYGKDSENEE